MNSSLNSILTSEVATAASNNFASSPLWYSTRSSGLAAFVLLTMAVVLGVLTTQRVATTRWPRFASQSLHRYVSLLAMVLLLVHIVTTVVDSYVDVRWWSTVIPFTSSYQTFFVGLGAVAFDLLLAITITSLLRPASGHRWWRLIHWSSYAAWPLALAHYLGSGTDATTTWGLAIALTSLAAVFIAVIVRLVIERREGPTRVIGGPR